MVPCHYYLNIFTVNNWNLYCLNMHHQRTQCTEFDMRVCIVHFTASYKRNTVSSKLMYLQIILDLIIVCRESGPPKKCPWNVVDLIVPTVFSCIVWCIIKNAFWTLLYVNKSKKYCFSNKDNRHIETYYEINVYLQ